MARKKKLDPALVPELQLKTWALRDDPLVRDYRDVHYSIVIDQLEWQGHVPSTENPTPLSPASRKRLLKQHARLLDKIHKKYRVSWSSGDPYLVQKEDWLSTVRATRPSAIEGDTNWRTPHSPRVRLFIIPNGAQKHRSRKGTLYQLPSDPVHLLNEPPRLSLSVDLSQINTRDLDRLASEFKRLVKEHLGYLPKDLKKPPSLWQRNLERDYRRFRQHKELGASFRLIAYWEKTGRESDPRPISHPVSKESSVRESVDRVHRVLFNTPYQARLHRRELADTRIEKKVRSYACPTHGQDCPMNCKYAKNFMKILDSHSFQH